MRNLWLSLVGIVCSTTFILSTCRKTTVESVPTNVMSLPEVIPTAPLPDVPAEPVLLSRHVLVIGDSEACAVGVHAHDVARANGDSVEVSCKSSTTVQYWSAGHLKKALDVRPDVDTLVVFLGTNHYLDRRAPVVSSVLDQIVSRGLRCIWVGNTAVKGHRWPINQLLRDAVTPVCVYFDTEATDVPLADGIHPGPAAARRWLEDVWRVIPPRYEDGSQETH